LPRVLEWSRLIYHRWKATVDRWGLEALNVRERRRPRMPNQIRPHLEQRIHDNKPSRQRGQRCQSRH
jgi:hypothetical protein